MKQFGLTKRITPVLILMILIGCKNDSFLDKFPLDSFSEPTYFKTENDLKFYANKLYDELPVLFMDSDNDSDNMVPQSINSFLAGTYSIPSTGGGWKTDDWANIRRCNFFLKRYERAETSAKNIYGGEVSFFRAFFYWQKVIRFGDVPLVLRDLDDNSEELFGPRTPRKEVMDQVLKDLNFAVDNLPEKTSAAAGRLNKDIALALKSRICLWEGTFRKYHNAGDENVFLEASADASGKLISGGNYSLYSTDDPQTDYWNLFIQEDLSGNTESIFHRTYIRNISTHNYTRAARESNTGASKSFVDDYLFTDGKPIGLTSFSYDDSHPAKEVENRDPRYKQTIAIPGFVWANGDNVNEPLVLDLPSIGSSVTSTGYWLIKGRSSDLEQSNANQCDIDIFYLRYAEVLLNYAEARYELSGTLTQDELDRTINKLRDRVGMPHLTPNPPADPSAIDYGYDISPLLYEIRRERRVELMGEGFRFNDILRWKAGRVLENMKTIRGMKLTEELRKEYTTDISKIEVDENNYIIVYPSLPNGRKWQDKMYFYPLPIEQINLCNYSQNPGW